MRACSAMLAPDTESVLSRAGCPRQHMLMHYDRRPEQRVASSRQVDPHKWVGRHPAPLPPLAPLRGCACPPGLAASCKPTPCPCGSCLPKWHAGIAGV